MSSEVPIIIQDDEDHPTTETLLSKLSTEISDSASLFAGQCHFSSKPNDTQPLEQRRKKLIEDCLNVTRRVFDDSISDERTSLPFISILASHSRQLRPITRSESHKKRKNEDIIQLEPTPLDSLYLGSESDGIILDDRAIWNQISLRHRALIGWVKQALDMDELEEGDEDLLAEKRRQGLGLGSDTDDQMVIDQDSSDETELEDFEGSDDQDQIFGGSGTDDDDSESSGSERESRAYVTRLNDQEGSSDDDSEEGTDHDSSNEPTIRSYEDKPDLRSKKDRSETDLSIESLESRSRSRTRTRRERGARSEVDDTFFNLAEFEEEADQGESQMRRQLRIRTGHDQVDEDGESDEDEDDIDLFSSLKTGIDPDEEDDDEESDEDGDEGVMNLSNVADLRYGDFFDPPTRSPPQKSKGKVTSTEKTTEKHKKTRSEKPLSGGSNRKSPRVMFSESVTVKEIPAKNKGIRVSEMMSGSPFDDDDEDEGDILLSDSESEDSSISDPGSSSSDDGSEGSDEVEFDSESDMSGDPEERTMSRFSGDLFDDGFSDQGSDRDSSGPNEEGVSLSKHAKKLKLLSKQIEELEAENVAKKDWTLKGEAAARDRPQNSLLEEDLEFEHIQKIAPAVTEEKTLGLESLIKQRILEGQFDDVVRRRPIDPKAFLPSRLLELQDTQSSRSLAEVYEDEYRATKTKEETGIKVKDKKDEKLEQAHVEIGDLFEDLCGKLDALSNAHFTPKAPKATIRTINNLPSISLESALPTATGAGTLLAPEELYAIDPKAVQRDRSELSHVQKQAERRERKKSRKLEMKKIEIVTGKVQKPHQPGEKAIEKMSTKEQKQISLDSLSKVEGVTIIGKRSLGSEEGPKKARKLESGTAYKL